MSLARSWRARRRRIAITSAVGLGLDSVCRWRERLEMRRGAGAVRVVYFHGTPPGQAENFRRHLAWLQRHFRLIDFATFEHALGRADQGDRDKPPLLLTFDDGLASNYDVAAPILEEFGVRGVFFVVPAFSMRSGEAARQFCRDRLRQKHLETSMTPSQIADLAARGHVIGNHTLSHANLLRAAPHDYHCEIVESAGLIESWIGRPVEAFAWPFTWKAITADAYRLAARRHRYCFAPCAGRIRGGAAHVAPLWRASVEVHAPLAEIRFQCSGLADLAALTRRRLLARRLTAHQHGTPLERRTP